MEPDQISFKSTGEEVKYKGKYRAFVNKYYSITKNGKTSNITWETIDNPNPSQGLQYGVVVIPKIKNENKLLVIDSLRFAIDKRCLEFPGGIIDSEETQILSTLTDEEEKKKIIKQIVIQAAKRELKEETGYEGEFAQFMTIPTVNDPIGILSNIYFDPWKSFDAAILCLFEIDKTIISNQTPQQELDDCEIIQVHEVDIDNLLQFINDKTSNEGMGCSSQLYSLALGLQLKNVFK